MKNEVETFDPSTLMQGVRDRVKATFVSLIPDEQWEQMIVKETDDFFKEKDDGYSNRTYKSDFQTLVREELNELAKVKIKEVLKEYTNEVWKDGKLDINESMKKLIKENSSELIYGFLNQMMKSTINNLISQLPQQRY
jgi:hypothetical protein